MSADEFMTLAADLGKASVEVTTALRAVVQEGISDVKDAWRENATATSGVHGKHYPNSITYETRVLAGTIIGEVGPDSSKPQGSMGRGFEFGSRNQPPHLDGLRAVDSIAPAMEKRFNTALGFLLP